MMDARIVKQEFERFLDQHLSPVSPSAIDEVLLQYIVSVLEELGDDESFDLDGFVEMMAAYIPGFETIDSENVWKWMLDLVTQRAATMKAEKSRQSEDELTSGNVESNRSALNTILGVTPKDTCTCEKSENGKSDQPSTRCNKDTDTKTTDAASSEFASLDASFTEKVAQLVELFPDACSLEIKRCLLVANSDVEDAASLMLLKGSGDVKRGLETVELVDFQPKEHHPSAKRQVLGTKDEQNLKDFVLNRYLYVDVDDDKKTHRPVAAVKGGDSKKMVRYLNNQVITTKGERYTQIKREENEDMKKTYVNLKPARKYRFH